MDLDLWQRIIGVHGPDCVQSIPDEVAAYRYHAESKTCRETDPFALEEYALLFDLAVSLGARLTDSLAAVRASACFPSAATAWIKQPIQPAQAEAAFLCRLLIDDSLLFRALHKTSPVPASLLKHFIGMLDEIEPLLVEHFPTRSAAAIRSSALVAAAQSLPVFSALLHCKPLDQLPRCTFSSTPCVPPFAHEVAHHHGLNDHLQWAGLPQ